MPRAGVVCVCVYLGVHVRTAVCWPLALAETVGRKEDESDVVYVTLCAFCQTCDWPPEYGVMWPAFCSVESFV